MKKREEELNKKREKLKNKLKTIEKKLEGRCKKRRKARRGKIRNELGNWIKKKQKEIKTLISDYARTGRKERSIRKEDEK